MKKLFLLVLALILFIACNNKPQRYFEESAEIQTTKAALKLMKPKIGTHRITLFIL